MNSTSGLLLLIVLYFLFYIILGSIFYNAMSVIVAGILAALVGLAISLLRGRKS